MCRYSICVRQEDGFCCVEYQVCPDQRGTLPGGLPSGFSFDGTQANSRVDTNCRKADNSLDFISIPASCENVPLSILADAKVARARP